MRWFFLILLSVSLVRAGIVGVEVASAHFVSGSVHNRVHAVNVAFCDGDPSGCPLGREAVEVARCESGPRLWPWARNGQYLGMFQFGSWARETFGFSWSPWAQARSAFAYYRRSGWSGWECRP